ncbi:MAG TPA: FtsX-like permease family protein, partial [Myxococcota bacterium]|nr:FtsX-like permease family protein [Myxococcota bacterium]
MRPHPKLPLPLLLAVRTHLGRHRALSLVTVCAIAASVTLATALEMSSRSAEGELQRTARELAGAAEIEVVGGTLGVSEDLLEIVVATPGVSIAVPFVQATFRVDRRDAAGASIHVLGVDLLADPSIRAYAGEATVEDPLRLIAGTDSVVVSRLLAERLNLRTGDALPVRSGKRPLTLTVRGVLSPKGLAEAYGGQIAVMDVYALQAILGRSGWLDRIDVVASKGASVDAVMGAMRAALGGRATVRRSAAHDTWIEGALTMIRVVVSALMLVAIVVASLVSYSALSLFVDRRLQELALLRAAGLEPRRVRRFLYLDAALLAVLGGGVGLLIGGLLSQGFLRGLSWISGFLQGIELQHLEFRASTVVTAAVVGGVVAFGGVLEPAWRATRSSPLDALLGGEDDEDRTSSRWRGLPLALSVIAALCLLTLFAHAPPLARVAAILAAGLIALGLFAHFVLPRLLQWLRSLIEIVFPGVGRLAGASLAARPTETALSFVCVGGVVAGVMISLTVAQSAAHTLDGWMESQFRGGVLVTAGALLSARPEEPISPETVRIIRETPGVRGVFDHVGEQVLYRDEEVLLAAGSMDVLARFGRLPVVGGEPRAVAEAVASGEIAISDQFARHFGVSTGESITLDTPKGARSFRVAGIIRDYAGPAGSLNIDIAVFDELWPRRGSRDLVLWTEGDPETVITQIRERAGGDQSLFFVYGDDLARFASRLLSRFQGILASISIMTALLGGIAVWNLMLSAVTARTRELASLLAMGATRRQVRALTLIDGLLLGVGGGVGGMLLGVCSAYPI